MSRRKKIDYIDIGHDFKLNDNTNTLVYVWYKEMGSPIQIIQCQSEYDSHIMIESNPDLWDMWGRIDLNNQIISIATTLPFEDKAIENAVKLFNKKYGVLKIYLFGKGISKRIQ